MNTVSDGFGNVWPQRCSVLGCNGTNQVMRPGKIQCTKEHLHSNLCPNGRGQRDDPAHNISTCSPAAEALMQAGMEAISGKPLQDLPATPRGLDDEVGYFTEETHRGITFQNPPLSPTEIEQAKRLKAGRDHPEAFCKECGRPNVTWFVNSNLWNQVMRRNGQPEPIICMVCFVKRAEAQGIIPTSWQLIPENYDALQQEAPVRTAAPAKSEGQNTEPASGSGPQPTSPEREKDSRDPQLTKRAREFIALPLAQWRDIDGEKFGKEEDRRSLAEFIADILVAFACELGPDPHRELLADAQIRDMEIMHCGHPYKYVTHGIPGAQGCLFCELETTKKELENAKHYCVSAAADLRSWRAHLRSGESEMRPGIAEPTP